MKGLVLKDLLVLKVAMKTVIMVVILFGFMGSMSGSAYMSTFASVYAAILPMTCMAYDERSKFNRFAMTLPVSVKELVLSRYITGLVLAAAAMVIALVQTVISGGDVVLTAVLAVAIPVFYHTFMLPIMFNFGSEKSRLIVMVGVVFPAIGISVLEELGVLDKFIAALSTMNGAVVAATGAAVLLVLYIASIFISIAICKRKEW